MVINFRLAPPTNNHDITVKSAPSKIQTKESPTISSKTEKPIGNYLIIVKTSLWYLLFYITINNFYININIFQLDKELTGKYNILGKNTEKETSDFRRIRSEATIIVKEVSNSYSEALDALKSERLISMYFNHLRGFPTLAKYDEDFFFILTLDFASALKNFGFK